MKNYLPFVIILFSFVVTGFGKRPTVGADLQPVVFGYTDKGDSLEFIFGFQKMIKIGTLEFVLDNRRKDIKTVQLAGDFNGWSPDNAAFRMQQVNDKIYHLVLSKKSLGKKGDTRLFKFVLNGKYWIEPPAEAVNRITGKDGNTNLFCKL